MDRNLADLARAGRAAHCFVDGLSAIDKVPGHKRVAIALIPQADLEAVFPAVGGGEMVEPFDPSSRLGNDGIPCRGTDFHSEVSFPLF
jgi:hypothetical protein